ALLLSFVGGAFPYLLINTATTAPSGNPGQQVTTSGGGSLLVSLIYFVLFWSSFGGGRTLGMRLFGLKVVREEDLGQMGVLSAFVRWIGLWLSFALCFIGVIWVAFDSRHQGWHDKIARTLVLHQ
ncbi:MAG: RDD family protein, partial [Chloroflexi bacterium]